MLIETQIGLLTQINFVTVSALQNTTDAEQPVVLLHPVEEVD